MSYRTLASIKTEISARIVSNEYLPQFIEVTTDLTNFSNAIAEFIAPYIQQIEILQDIYNNQSLLANYLLSKGMYLAGNETLVNLQTIASLRYDILLKRGTSGMITEVQRLNNDEGGGSRTSIVYNGVGTCGWVTGHSSPGYRTSSTALNLCYSNMREVVVFNIHNLSVNYTNLDIKSILQEYFEPKHIRCLYNFI